MNVPSDNKWIQERDWWKTLAEAYGMKLGGWTGLPPADAVFYARDGVSIVIAGALAQAMYKMAQLAGRINPNDKMCNSPDFRKKRR